MPAIWPSSSCSSSVRVPCSTPTAPPRKRAACSPSSQPRAARLDADEPRPRLVEEGAEQADRVAAAADAGDRQVRPGAAGLLLELPLRLVADHLLEVAHHARIGVRPEHRAQHVVGVAHVGHPVAQRLVDGVLERPAARVDGRDLGAEQPHALDVEPLAAHVLLAHVDGAGLSPSSAAAVAVATPCWPAPVSAITRRLPMRLGEQRLAEGVVDLVGAGVEQVLALEPDPRPAELVAQPRAPGTAASGGRRSRAAGRRAAPGRPACGAACRRRRRAPRAAPSASRAHSGRRRRPSSRAWPFSLAL